LLDEEVDLNDIIISDCFGIPIDKQSYTKYSSDEPLIDKNNEKEYFKFLFDDYEFKKKKLDRIGISVGREQFPSNVKDLPIIKEYFSKMSSTK
jgi:hypothetical protein